MDEDVGVVVSEVVPVVVGVVISQFAKAPPAENRSNAFDKRIADSLQYGATSCPSSSTPNSWFSPPGRVTSGNAARRTASFKTRTSSVLARRTKARRIESSSVKSAH